MPHRSPSTNNVLLIAEELAQGQKEAEKKAKQAIPFMEEGLSARDRHARIAAMSPQERAALAARYGLDAVMKLWE